MKRFGQVIGIRPECLEAYKECHANARSAINTQTGRVVGHPGRSLSFGLNACSDVASGFAGPPFPQSRSAEKQILEKIHGFPNFATTGVVAGT